MPAETQTRINHPLSVTRFSTSLDVLTTSCCFVLFFSLWTCFSLWSGPHKYSDEVSMTYANCRSGYYHTIFLDYFAPRGHQRPFKKYKSVNPTESLPTIDSHCTWPFAPVTRWEAKFHLAPVRLVWWAPDPWGLVP